MPVTLDDLMRDVPQERRTAIEREAAALAGDYRRRNDSAGLGSHAAVGIKADTGQRCPASGVWKVETVETVTAPIAIDNLMPPYADRPVTWILVQAA